MQIAFSWMVKLELVDAEESEVFANRVQPFVP
jgi:hypothetical protein